MKNRIGIIRYAFSGNYLNDILNLCEQNNIEVDLFSFNEEEKIQSKQVRNNYFLDVKFKLKDIKSREIIENAIKKLVNIDDYDYILSDTLALSFTCNIVHNNSLARRMDSSSNKIVTFIQKIGHIKRLEAEKKVYNDCPKIVAVSNIVKQDLVENYSVNPEKFIVAYPGTNNTGEVCEKKEEGTFNIGISANGFSTKGGYNLLNAIKIIKKKYPELKFKAIIIYPQYKKNSFVDLYTKFFGIKDNIEFLSFQKNMNNYYSKLDCYVCASTFEAFGRMVTEAMLKGVPVIVGSNAGASEIIKDGENGFIFKYDKNRYKNLAEKIINVYNGRNSLQEVIKNAQETAEKLSWKNFAQTIFDALYR